MHSLLTNFLFLSVIFKMLPLSYVNFFYVYQDLLLNFAFCSIDWSIFIPVQYCLCFYIIFLLSVSYLLEDNLPTYKNKLVFSYFPEGTSS